MSFQIGIPQGSYVMAAMAALEKMEANSSRNFKLQVLREQKDNLVLKEMFRLAYDWLMPFHIAKLPKIEPSSYEAGQHLLSVSFSELKELLENLHERSITGNEARDTIEKFLSELSEQECKWYTRVLLKDLRVGVSIKTFAKVWPQLVTQWGVMLAESYDGIETLDYPKYGEPKLDGMRITIVVSDGKGIAYSRGMKEYPRLQFIIDQLIEKHPGDWVYDGEFFYNSWNETTPLLRSKTLTAEKQKKLAAATFYLFDVLPLDEFMEGESTEILRERRKRISAIKTKNVSPINAVTIDSDEEVAQWYQKFLDAGYEGIMLKDPEAKYATDRGKAWLKYKPVKTIEGEILDIEAGSGRNANRLGAFKCLLESGEISNVGIGFSDKQREDYYSDDLKGCIIELLVQKETQQVAKARFPVFHRFRDDRPRYEFTGRK
jgi:Straboviridae DNA ligase